MREVDETHAREDVPAELTLHERHEAVVLRVDALKGSRDSFLSFFLFGLCATACGRRLWGIHRIV